MGCDIHLIVEKRVNGKWERVDKLPPRPCSRCDGKGKYPNGNDCYWCVARPKEDNEAPHPGEDRRPYHDRNYTVFSILADVRNDGYVQPISEPRGLPDDATHAAPCIDEYGEDRSEWEHGDHSFSWLTLAELQAYDWKQVIKDEGWVDAPAFAEWDKNGAKGPPTQWSGGVGGGLVEHVTNSRMREYLAGETEAVDSALESMRGGKPHYYTLIQWTVPLADYCRNFLSFMETLAALGAPNDVRIVFGFDS